MTDTAPVIAIQDFPPTPVAIWLHHGPPQTLDTSIQRFIAWRLSMGLTAERSPTFTIFYSNPRTTPPQAYRLGLCVGTDRPVIEQTANVHTELIPGGRCAVLRVTEAIDTLEPAAEYLFQHWLPRSGEAVRDFPLFAQRHLFPRAPGKKPFVDLFLPLQTPAR